MNHIHIMHKYVDIQYHKRLHTYLHMFVCVSLHMHVRCDVVKIKRM
jgi:hypothetical protein